MIPAGAAPNMKEITDMKNNRSDEPVNNSKKACNFLRNERKGIGNYS